MEADASAGAKLTALTISSNSPDHPTYNCTGSCLTSWQQLATQAGFADRAALYACDEPAVDPSRRWQLCHTSIAERDTRWPALPTLVTTTLAQAKAAPGSDLSGGIDTLVPIVQALHPSGAAGDTSLGTRPQYDSWLSTATSPTRKLWTYTSCVSYGCGAANETGVGGWPGYAIDAPASAARAMGWLLDEYNVGGELYYEMAQNLPNAWTPGGLWSAGDNGDGALFYPGTPARIGGQHDIPLDTLRMKRIRDGREDNEYLRLAARGQASQANGIARGLFPNPYSTSVSDAALQSARSQLTSLIVGPSQPGKVTLTSLLSLSPATPVASGPVTASFTVTNSGGAPVTIGYFLAGARTATGGHVDFPTSPAVTLQPGQSYTYTRSATLTAGSYTIWPGYYDGSTWIELGPHTSFTVRPSGPGKVTLTSSLSLSPSTPVASGPVTSSFNVTNSGAAPVKIGYFLAGARTATGGHVDFPTSPAVTLQPGQSYTYTRSATLTAGSYTIWPGYYDGSTWIELAPHTAFTVR